MFDRLVQFIIDILYLFKFWYIIEPYEQGHSFHLGYLGRPLDSGWHVIWPFHITTVLYYDITDATAELEPLDLTTKDNVMVRVGGMFRYKHREDKAYEFLCLLGDDTTSLEDFLAAAVAKIVENSTKEELFSTKHSSEAFILDEARRHLSRYGYKLYDFFWTIKVAPKVYRVIIDRSE